MAISRIRQEPTGINLLHNGAMQIAQRGTSSSGITTDGYFTADRWNLIIASLGTWTQSVENDAPTGSGLKKSLKMLCSTADAAPAAGDYCVLNQRIEGQDLQRLNKGSSSASMLTISFWVKSNVTGTHIVSLYDNDNNRRISKSYTVNSSATWEYKTISFNGDTTGAFDNNNELSLYVQFWLGAGTTYSSGTLATSWETNTNANVAVGQTNVAAAINNYFQITGVQLEVGNVASPFQFKPYAEDLRDCLRYSQRWSACRLPVLGSTTSLSIMLNSGTPLRVPPLSLEHNLSNANWTDSDIVGNTWRALDPQLTWLTRTGGTITFAGLLAFGTTFNALEAYGMTFNGTPRQVSLGGNLYIQLNADL